MALHFVLDGYNLIKQDSHLAVLKLRAGREGLLKLIVSRELQGSSSNLVTVVFDAKMGFGEEIFAPGIRLIFTDRESADEWIKRCVEEDAHPKNIVVVTDDREIRHYVRALGAALMGTREFLEGRGSRRKELDAKRQRKRLAVESKEISSNVEHKITTEMSRYWLKEKKT